jgi:hypothetical protein
VLRLLGLGWGSAVVTAGALFGWTGGIATAWVVTMPARWWDSRSPDGQESR